MGDFDEIKRLVNSDQFIISNHARNRMFQRNITTDMIIEMIANGEIIEEYSDDFPCPSVLVLGYTNQDPLHVVVGHCGDHVRIIMVYKPDKGLWIEHKKRIRKT